jgi:hypothetical protein
MGDAYSGKELGAAALAVGGTSPSDVYLVGGLLGNSGYEATALHFDRTSWRKLSPGGGDSFWWVSGPGSLNKVWGTSSAGLYAVGEAGTLWHRKGVTWAPMTNAGNLQFSDGLRVQRD